MTPVVIIIANRTAFNNNARIKSNGTINGRKTYPEDSFTPPLYRRDGARGNVMCISDTNGFEDIVDMPGVTLSSWEEIFGYRRLNEEGQWEDIPFVTPMRAKYNAANGGLAIISIPGGYDMSHLIDPVFREQPLVI